MKTRVYMLVIVFLLMFGSNSHAGVELAFGLYASDKPSTLRKMFHPILSSLESEIAKHLKKPITIKSRFSKTYEGGIKDLIEGRVDFARFGPASYIEAKKANPDIEILAIESKKGKKTFNGIICVARESKIQSINGLKGKSFAFGNKKSTIGRFLSQKYLVEHGIKASDLARYDYMASHREVGIAVARGNFDAGALKESTFNKLVKKGARLRALAMFPNVTKPWIARAGLPDNIKNAIKNSLLQLNDPAVLKGLKKAGFLPGTDDDYAGIRFAINNNDAFFE